MKCNLARALGIAVLVPAFVSCASLQDDGAAEALPAVQEEQAAELAAVEAALQDAEEAAPPGDAAPAEEAVPTDEVLVLTAPDAEAPEGEPLEFAELSDGAHPAEPSAREDRRIAFYGGARSFSDDLWDADSGVTLGVDYSHVDGDGLGYDVGLLGYIGSESGDVNGATAELYGGVRKAFRRGDWTPYVGAGAALVLAGLDDDQGTEVADDIEFAPGLYLRAGVLYDIDEKFFVGLDVRALTLTDFEFARGDGDADYVQGLISFGLRL